MTRRIWLVVAIISGTLLAGNPARETHSCSTFLLPAADGPYVGHNLDDNYDVPGAVFVNKRGVQKESISWEDDLSTFFGHSRSAPRIRWTSVYGSITYNTMGRDAIDGGMNEAGLYVGEMSLPGTERPKSELPRVYPYLWMQYLLDTCGSVDDVLASLDVARPGGPNAWHFFVADRQGNTAVIEFLEGQTVIYEGESMPVQVLCNAAYAGELEKLKRYQGFGGQEDMGLSSKAEDNRFAWAASMIEGYPASANANPVVSSFLILDQLSMGNNQWGVVCDLAHGRMYFRTVRARRIRYADLASFDLSCATPAMLLDINEDLQGDVAAHFQPYSEARNKQLIREALAPIDMGFLNNLFLKPQWGNRLDRYTRGFACSE